MAMTIKSESIMPYILAQDIVPGPLLCLNGFVELQSNALHTVPTACSNYTRNTASQSSKVDTMSVYCFKVVIATRHSLFGSCICSC